MPHERDAWCQLLAKWLKVSAIRERPVQRYSEVFGLGAEGQGFAFEVDYQLTFSFFLVKVEGCRNHFCCPEFDFQVWRYSLTVVMSLLSANLHQHALLLDRQHMHTLWRWRLAGQRDRFWREGYQDWSLCDAVLEALQPAHFSIYCGKGGKSAIVTHLHGHVDHVSIRKQLQQLAGEAMMPYTGS